jgi:hypothetical protein
MSIESFRTQPMLVSYENRCRAPIGFAKAIREAVCSFEGFGVAAVSRACNLRRKEAIQRATRDGIWRDYTAAVVIDELAPSFDLSFPSAIHIDILSGFSSLNKERAAECDECAGIIRIYFMQFECADGAWQWRGHQERVEEVVWHELLHVCGDSPSKGRTDGLLRQKWCGTEVIKEMVSDASSGFCPNTTTAQ